MVHVHCSTDYSVVGARLQKCRLQDGLHIDCRCNVVPEQALLLYTMYQCSNESNAIYMYFLPLENRMMHARRHRGLPVPYTRDYYFLLAMAVHVNGYGTCHGALVERVSTPSNVEPHST